MKPALLCVLVLLALIVASECQPRPQTRPGGRRPGSPPAGQTCQRTCPPGHQGKPCGPNCVCSNRQASAPRPGARRPSALQCVQRFAEAMVQ
uniref:Putative secreted protein n=1 Tax=Amblyomma cajennense TaxID=34607 RepID=A0A023FBT6_AMBCJ